MKYGLIIIFATIITACQAVDSADNKAAERAGSSINISGYPDFTAKEDHSKVEKFWIKTVSKTPQYPMHAALAGISGCVKIVYSINESGKPEGYRITGAFPEGIFEDNALAALARWRWEPAPTNVNKQPVLTSTQLDFVVSESKNVEAARENCSIQPI